MMEPERLWALLFHNSEGRILRDEFMDMGVWDMVNVIHRPGRDKKGEYWPDSVADPGLLEKVAELGPRHSYSPTKEGFKQMFFEMGRMRGHTDEQIEERWRRKHGRRSRS